MSSINPIFEEMGLTERDMIEWVVGKTFLIDYGIVAAVSADKTHVDVNHVVLQTLRGVQLSPTLTKGVELLFLGGGSQFALKWDVAVGDLVLLLALKDFVDPVKGVAVAGAATSGAHYTPDTMKAVPLAPYSSSSGFQMVVDNTGLLQLKNTTASLYTVLNNLLTALNTFATGLNPTTLAAQAAALVTALTPITTALGQLLKA